MKSSTIRRSNLSKEKMAVLEALSKYKTDSSDNTPNVYVRPSRDKELDLLWQNFKVNQKSDKSPNVYLATGFIAGVVTTIITGAVIGLSMNGIISAPNVSVDKKANVKNEKLNFVPAAEQAAEALTDEVYTVQSGDTMESILTRFYGGYTQERAWAVMNANNMKNPNKLSIGQKLTIPMKKD